MLTYPEWPRGHSAGRERRRGSVLCGSGCGPSRDHRHVWGPPVHTTRSVDSKELPLQSKPR